MGRTLDHPFFWLVTGTDSLVRLPEALVESSIDSNKSLFIFRLEKGTVHKVRHAIFGQFLPPLSHFVTHPGTPPKVHHTSRTPHFLVGLVQKTLTKAPCTNSLSIVRRGFCPGWFLSVPASVTIHLLQQKVKHHFKFHVSYV